MRCNSIKGIKFGHLSGRDQIANQRVDIKLQLPKVDVHALDNPVK